MTRTEFAASESFLRWLRRRSRPYEIYHTPQHMYAVPMVSTRPVVYGIYRFQGDKESLLEQVRDVIDPDDIYPLTEFEFDETRGQRSED